MGYEALLPRVVDAAERAGALLVKAFDAGHRPGDKPGMYALGYGIEGSSFELVQGLLAEAVPGAGWFDKDRQEPRELAAGAWWIVDGTEGAVNLVHGMTQWAAVISLVVDGVPELSVVRQPLADETWTAVRGGGAYRNGDRLRVSGKQQMDASIVTASQSGNSAQTHARFGRTVGRLLDRVLLVQNTVPTTFPILTVAAGHTDAFFQYEPDLPGTVAGGLMVAEAGGTVTDLEGEPWRVTAPGVLFAAPGLHAELLKVVAA